MPINLPLGLTSEEIRVLQEFRRLNADTLPPETIKAIKHPAGAIGEKAAASLAAKGFLAADGESYTITPGAKDFLAIEAKPMVEETSEAAASAAANPDADGV
ncbi:MAG TPA: hypothetical protein VNI54_08870 [Thermoanaerobaculia bacterium]|nr:hypothetical protein [Thermoanaerobaculia bacterium]